MYIVSLQDREGCSMLHLLLKRNNKIASHFYQQNGFIQEQQRNAGQDMQSVETTGKSGEQRRGAFCYKRERGSWDGAVINRVHGRKPGVLFSG